MEFKFTSLTVLSDQFNIYMERKLWPFEQRSNMSWVVVYVVATRKINMSLKISLLLINS